MRLIVSYTAQYRVICGSLDWKILGKSVGFFNSIKTEHRMVNMFKSAWCWWDDPEKKNSLKYLSGLILERRGWLLLKIASCAMMKSCGYYGVHSCHVGVSWTWGSLGVNAQYIEWSADLLTENEYPVDPAGQNMDGAIVLPLCSLEREKQLKGVVLSYPILKWEGYCF